MTEVPEHLLRASAEARARLTGAAPPAASDPDAAADPAAAPAPAPAAAPAPAVAATPDVPAVPEPVAPYVEAAQHRKTVPVWILPVLLFLPIWGIYYVGYLERPPAAPEGLLFEGGEVYAESCASCHGGGGGGGSGRQLNRGEVVATFPAGDGAYDGLAGHLSWVINGTEGTLNNEGANYGAPSREGGPRGVGSFGAMAGFGASLDLESLVAVVFHERVAHGQLDDEAAERELRVLEEFILIREEAGASDWDGESVASISEQLDEARLVAG